MPWQADKRSNERNNKMVVGNLVLVLRTFLSPLYKVVNQNGKTNNFLEQGQNKTKKTWLKDANVYFVYFNFSLFIKTNNKTENFNL